MLFHLLRNLFICLFVFHYRMVHLTQITAKKNVEAVLSLEPPVKKPASAYNLFVQELHRKLKQGNPDLQSKGKLYGHNLKFIS